MKFLPLCTKHEMSFMFSRRFRKIAKSDNFLISVRPSARPSISPHGTTRLTMHGFSWILIYEYFSKICRESSRFVKNMTKITRILHEDRCTFMTISRWIIPRIRNISDEKSQRKSKQAFYNFSKWPTWRTILLFYNTFITVLYMFRATSCSSSGGQIVLIQHLVL